MQARLPLQPMQHNYQARGPHRTHCNRQNTGRQCQTKTDKQAPSGRPSVKAISSWEACLSALLVISRPARPPTVFDFKCIILRTIVTSHGGHLSWRSESTATLRNAHDKPHVLHTQCSCLDGSLTARPNLVQPKDRNTNVADHKQRTGSGRGDRCMPRS